MSSTPDPWASNSTPAGDPWAAPSTGSDPWGAAPAPPPVTTHPLTRTSARANVSVQGEDKVKMDGYGAFAMGLADTVTFGFLDEAGAFVDSHVPTWLGGHGGTYEENLRRNRAILGQAEEEHGGAFMTGQIAGAFVPITALGKAKLAVEGVKAGRLTEFLSLAKAGAAQGALYGAGSSQSENLFSTERLRDGALGAAVGGVGGFVLGSVVVPVASVAGRKAYSLIARGRTPKIDFEFKVPKAGAVAEDVQAGMKETRLANAKAAPVKTASLTKETATAPKVPASEPAPHNPLTGKPLDELEQGAVVTAKELTENTEVARKSILDRVASLSPQEAKIAAQKLTKAMASGDLAKDPHFRSILGIDLSKATDAVNDAYNAAITFEEMTQAILEKAGMGKQTVKSAEAQLRARFGGSITEDELDKLVAAQKEANGGANIGNNMMMIAGMQFARATKELLPDVLKGVEGARDALATKLTDAIRISAKGQFLVSSAGRNLGLLSKQRNLAFTEVVDGAVNIEAPAAIKARVDAALAKLDDSELTELFSRVKDLSDLDNVQEILMNAERAEQVSGWIKARNSAGLWIKSNTLTVGSALRNTVGFVMHDVFRNTWARDLAAHVAEQAGELTEAQVLRFQSAVVKSLKWQAHGAGISAAFKRLKWEWLDSVEKIAGVAGDKVGLKYASTSRMAMIAHGYRPPALREVDFERGLAITDVKGFNQKLADRAAEGGAFATLVNGLERTYATAINTVDAAATTTGRIISGALDDWGRSYVKVREVYADCAGQAVREGLAKGYGQKELVEYVQNRTAKLAELPPEEILAQVEQKLVNGDPLDDVDKLLLRRDWAADKEADKVLFMDGPQTVGGRTAASAASMLDKAAGGFMLPGILMRYIRTPTRILERGLASYTPWGHMTDEVQKVLAKGGVEAAVERARMELGSMVIGIGVIAAASGMITITNGGYKNSSNLTGAPPMRLNLPGGRYADLNGLDPLSMSISLGGIAGQAWKAAQDAGEYTDDHEEAIASAMHTAFMATRESVFEKSYLTGVRDLFKAWFGQDEGGPAGAYGDMLTSYFSNLIPMSGVSRQLNETVTGKSLEATTFMDKMFKAVPGLGAYLPARVDALGNEVEGRTFGIAGGTTTDTDEVTRKVAALGIDINSLKKADPTGFDLTSEELSELRKLRATEATNKDGLTMKEALAELIDDPAFQSLPSKDQKQDAVTEVMAKFNEPARALFEERNQDYLSTRSAHRSFKEYMADGLQREVARQQALGDVEAEGLPAPSRLP